jgi:hypothetical protein
MQHFNEDFVSIISTLHVSALIGHLQVLTVLTHTIFMLTYEKLWLYVTFHINPNYVLQWW